jgi:hypothetical protein
VERRPASRRAPEPQKPAIKASKVKWKVIKDPHLVAVGPSKIRVAPVAGPLVRRPPLLPPPKVVAPEPKPIAADLPPPAEPSTLSGDANPILLPPVKATADSTQAPVKPEEPKESVLVPAEREELELKDAVKYFEPPHAPYAPNSPGGPQILLPAIVPYSSPAAPQPNSRATYRKEKE